MTTTSPTDPPADDPNARAQTGGYDAIRCRSEDRLQRSGFAERIARQITLAPARSSIVLAVTGPWGSGKTSVLNMITEALEEKPDITILEFNPWLFSSPQELVGRFFAELSAELMGNPEKRFRTVGEALQRYGSRLAPVRFLPVVGDLAGLVVGGAKAVGDSLVAATDEGNKSLRTQHRDLAKLLSEIPGRIVVVLDDIDRILRSDDVREVMRLVRLTSDLPNITYVMAFDRTKVEAALTEADARGVVIQAGRGYLEKIVQQMYDVPAIRGSDLESILLDGIETVVDTQEHGPVDVHVFLNTFHRCIRPLFTTIREVRNYLSILPVALEDCGEEVALSDVLALEALRLLVPDSYALLPVTADALTTVDTGLAGMNQTAGHALFDAFADAGGANAEIVRAMSAELFPASRRFIDNRHYSGDFLATWRKARRVAHRDVLRFYLSRALPEGVLSAELVDLAYRALGDEVRLTTIVNALSADEFTALLERLEDYEEEYPRDAVETACAVLMNQHHRLGRSKDGMFGVDPSMRLFRVVVRLLRRIDDEVQRTQAVERVLQRIEALSGQYFLIDWVGHRQGVGLKLVPADVAEEWMTDLVAKVVSSDAALLAAERDLVVLLDASVAQNDKNRTAVGAMIGSDDVLMAILCSSLRSDHRWDTGEVVTTRTMSIPWPAMERLFSKDLLTSRLGEWVARVDREAAGPDARLALELAEQWLASDGEAAATPPAEDGAQAMA
jgi:predicted KAP-like P-loop ATPase